MISSLSPSYLQLLAKFPSDWAGFAVAVLHLLRLTSSVMACVLTLVSLVILL